MLMDPSKYTFTVEKVERGIKSILTQVETGKTKEFFQAYGCVENLIKHFNSLTDSQCEQWFEKRKKENKKENKNG